MNNSKPAITSLLNALGVLVYASAVSWVMFNGERIFGKVNNFLGPLMFLLLFVFSAAVVGSLVLGKPILLYLDGLKAEALKLFFYTLAWLFLITIVVFVLHFALK